LLLDGDGIIRFANPAVWNVFGWDPVDLVGARLDRLQLDDNGASNWWYQARNLGLNRIVDTPGKRKDGSVIDVDIVFCELRLHDQQMFAAFARDITERKRHLDEIN